MASRVLNSFEAEAFHASTFTQVYTRPLLAASVLEAPAFTKEEDGLHVSTAEALRGAKGVLMAIGLEAGVALCFFGIWQVWHILR